ncbi:phosphate ABC transporter substrate-binding protein [uncultured Tyzzerella sp.]|uniref:phosphate ABC transporter substrate-binding protein n=1 Tax=uncultured Tyzzerella sp. TaxID=2321398 RepID=UPI00294331A4|nr:phosphate ABC transporter substrate-binding protein [uncultured Tyzzerella sp.]
MKKLLKFLLTSTLIMSTLVGCGGTGTGTESENGDTTLSGSITMNGSTSMEKLSNSLAEVFMQKYPNVTVTAQFTGSSAGIEAVANKTVDIGNSSRKLKQEELDKGIIENVVALDGIAIITHPENTVSDLTLDQLKGIYDGTIKNWSEVGGEDMGIVVIGREAGSGTRGAFEEILDLKDKAVYSQEIDSTGAVVGKVESAPGTIGYVSLDVIHNSKAKALKIDGAEPTADTIKSGQYMLSRPFVMATNGEISAQKPEVQELFNFLKSEEGKQLIEKVGLVNVD